MTLPKREEIEIMELDERVDMSIDPLFLAGTSPIGWDVNIPNCNNSGCCNK